MHLSRNYPGYYKCWVFSLWIERSHWWFLLQVFPSISSRYIFFSGWWKCTSDNNNTQICVKDIFFSGWCKCTSDNTQIRVTDLCWRWKSAKYFAKPDYSSNYSMLGQIFWRKKLSDTLVIQGGFFNWSALKMTMYEEKLKYLNWSANCSSRKVLSVRPQ